MAVQSPNTPSGVIATALPARPPADGNIVAIAPEGVLAAGKGIRTTRMPARITPVQGMVTTTTPSCHRGACRSASPKGETTTVPPRASAGLSDGRPSPLTPRQVSAKSGENPSVAAAIAGVLPKSGEKLATLIEREKLRTKIEAAVARAALARAA